MYPILKSKNITLKVIEPKDAPELFTLTDKNRDYLRKWLPWVDSTKEISDTNKYIRESLEKLDKGEGINFGIWLEDKLVGYIDFNYIHKINKSANIGYWLDQDYQGKGIMTESCKLTLSYGFKNLGLNRIGISHAAGNEKSSAIPNRLGFTKEGHFRKSGFVNGQFVDEIYYGLLADEWKE